MRMLISQCCSLHYFTGFFCFLVCFCFFTNLLNERDAEREAICCFYMFHHGRNVDVKQPPPGTFERKHMLDLDIWPCPEHLLSTHASRHFKITKLQNCFYDQ